MNLEQSKQVDSLSPKLIGAHVTLIGILFSAIAGCMIINTIFSKAIAVILLLFVLYFIYLFLNILLTHMAQKKLIKPLIRDYMRKLYKSVK